MLQSSVHSIGGRLKRAGKGGVYKVLVNPPLDGVMARLVGAASSSTQEVLRKVVAQPHTYEAEALREVTRYGLQWRLRPRDYFQWHQFYGFRDEVLEVLLAVARRSRVVLDVGANIGFYSLLMAREMEGRGQVWSFEPNPRTLEILRDHARYNRIANVASFGFALSDSQGSAVLRDAGDGESGKFSLRALESKSSSADAFVETATVDGQAALHKLKDVDLIKIDVEGFEPEVLSGAFQTIAKFRPYLCFELTPRWFRDRADKARRAFSMLLSAGYEFQQVVPGHSNPPRFRPIELLAEALDFDSPTKQLNVLAVHPSRERWDALTRT